MEIKELMEIIDKFNKDRDWDQYHSPSNLSKSICIEACELLECFQWDNENFKLEEVKEELADVMIYCLQLAIRLGVDPIEIMKTKIEKNALKYPVEKAKGSSAKYDKL